MMGIAKELGAAVVVEGLREVLMGIAKELGGAVVVEGSREVLMESLEQVLVGVQGVRKVVLVVAEVRGE